MTQKNDQEFNAAQIAAVAVEICKLIEEKARGNEFLTLHIAASLVLQDQTCLVRISSRF